jgi:hypothetical protein
MGDWAMVDADEESGIRKAGRQEEEGLTWRGEGAKEEGGLGVVGGWG